MIPKALEHKQMETLEVIRKRCSLKEQISPREIEPEILYTVLDAARYAASSRNHQPWRFVVVQGQPAVQALVDAAVTGTNAVIRNAPVVIAVCARPQDDSISNGREYYLFDTGMAVANLLLAATDFGLVTHPMAGFDEEALKRHLHIPEDVRVLMITPLAYPASESYDEAARDRLNQRSRKAFEEVVFFNRWGETQPEMDAIRV